MRYLSETIDEFSSRKIVLLAGPRQVGKTTLAQSWVGQSPRPMDLNWDIDEDREQILRKDFATTLTTKAIQRLLLDELHKYTYWKRLLKGLYDKKISDCRIVVTGSARLDILRKGGESLFGRHEFIRLHPFSVGEIRRQILPSHPDRARSQPFVLHGEQDCFPLHASDASVIWENLSRFSGFPEPYTEANDAFYRRWSNRRRDLLVKNDIRVLSDIKDLSLMEHLMLLLPERVGSLLSVNNLRIELDKAFDTVRTWLSVLEDLYFSFRIYPYTPKISRSLKKEAKLYLWDWALIGDPGARFENMVASHLLKSIHYWNDLGLGDYSLHYLRDKEKREVDFLVTNAKVPLLLVEAKLSDRNPSSSLHHFSKRVGSKVPAVQLVMDSDPPERHGSVIVSSAADFFAEWV